MITLQAMDVMFGLLLLGVWAGVGVLLLISARLAAIQRHMKKPTE
ncbi:MAG: hypothetical protein JWO13_3131 [Acidobacteriales bacterium]|nr:hypothetical protein [Terriglobales bacterium]